MNNKTHNESQNRQPSSLTKIFMAVAALAVVGGGLLLMNVGGSDETGNCAAPGSKCSDGSIFAGLSSNADAPIYTTPADAPGGTYTWTRATEYCADLVAHGHDDWSVPSLEELQVLYNNRAVIGDFNVTASYPYGKYWSSTTDPDDRDIARVQYFDDGIRSWVYKGYADARVRCVRNGAQEQAANMRLRQMMTIIAPAAGS